MTDQTENSQKPKEPTSRELLEKSAQLKKKTAELKAQMEATAKACDDLLHKGEKESPADQK